MEYIKLAGSLSVFLLIAYCFSENKKKISLKIVIVGVFWQILFAVLLFKVPSITNFFEVINTGLQAVSASTTKAVEFCFGNLAIPSGNLGFILALQGFPVLIVISALSAVLIHWKILPVIIKTFSIFFRKAFDIGGTLGIAVSANMFTGMRETPLVIRPYLKHLSHSEIFSLMVCGTTGIAASVVMLYEIIIHGIVDAPIRHIISSIIIGVPGALTISRIMVPETSSTYTEESNANFNTSQSTLDAIFNGIMDGGKVVITIIAMLIGFLGLIDVLNQILGLLPEIAGEALSMQRILGWIMFPIAYIMGITGEEAHIAGSLIGTKLILNEIMGLQSLAAMGAEISYRTKLMMIYALCGFANFGSIGIMIGIYSSLEPDRKDEIIKLGMKSIIAGTIASCMSASIVGMLLL